jgi:hypothetical protein
LVAFFCGDFRWCFIRDLGCGAECHHSRRLKPTAFEDSGFLERVHFARCRMMDQTSLNDLELDEGESKFSSSKFVDF